MSRKSENPGYVYKLDSQDLALIAALQAEPRARAVRLGEMVGMSAPHVSARLRQLIDDRAVQVVGIIDYRALRRSYMAVALMRGVSEEELGALQERRGVVFAAQTVGAWDGLVCLVDVDQHAMEHQVELLRGICEAVEVQPVLDVAVTGLGREVPVLLRDTLDDDIACVMAGDARMSFTSLARALGVPEATARARAQRLLDGHVVTPLVLPDPGLFGMHAAGAVALQVSGPIGSLFSSVESLPGVITTLHLQGSAAAAVEVIAPDVSSVAALRDRLKALPQVREAEVLIYGKRTIGRWPLPAR